MHASDHTVPASVFVVCIAALLGVIVAIGAYRLARTDSMTRTGSLALAAGAFTGAFYFLLVVAQTVGIV